MGDSNPWSWLQAQLYSLFARNPRSNRLAVDLCGLDAASVFLDIGCGPGAAVRLAAPAARRSIGVDNSPTMLAIAEKRSAGVHNVEFREGAAEALPVDDDSITHAVTIHAFHHWSDQSEGLSEVRRVLAPGGRFLIIERRTKGAHGMTPGRAHDLANEMSTDGFRTVEVTEHDKQMVLTATL